MLVPRRNSPSGNQIPFSRFLRSLNWLKDLVLQWDIYNEFNSVVNFHVFTARKSIAEAVPLIRNEKDLKKDHPEEQEFTIYGMFLRASILHVLRAPEPSLKLQYENIGCAEKATSQSERHNYYCSLREGYSYGLRNQLSEIVLDYVEKRVGK